MGRAAVLAFLITLSALLAAGCGADPVTLTDSTPAAGATISLAGSGTAQPLIELLADAYHQ